MSLHFNLTAMRTATKQKTIKWLFTIHGLCSQTYVIQYFQGKIWSSTTIVLCLSCSLMGKVLGIKTYDLSMYTFNRANIDIYHLSTLRPALEGPSMHRPLMSNCDPWQGQSKVKLLAFHFTALLKCGHTAAHAHKLRFESHWPTFSFTKVCVDNKWSSGER